MFVFLKRARRGDCAQYCLRRDVGFFRTQTKTTKLTARSSQTRRPHSSTTCKHIAHIIARAEARRSAIDTGGTKRERQAEHTHTKPKYCPPECVRHAHNRITLKRSVCLDTLHPTVAADVRGGHMHAVRVYVPFAKHKQF